jgi:hypothetical protein
MLLEMDVFGQRKAQPDGGSLVQANIEPALPFYLFKIHKGERGVEPRVIFWRTLIRVKAKL